MLSQTYRHSLALPLQRQRQERYSAADKFSGENLRAALRSSMAFSLLDLTASLKRQRELVSLDSRAIISSSTGLEGLAFGALGMSLSVSSLSSSLTDGNQSGVYSTGLSVIPKPPPTLWFCMSILRLFLKMGDWISSMCCLSEMVILTTLLVTTSFSLCGLGMGGAGMMLLMSSPTFTPFWKSDSKMLSFDPLFDQIQDRYSCGYFCFQPDFPLFASAGSLIYMFGAGMVVGSVLASCFSGDYFYYPSLSLEEKTFQSMFFFLSSSSFISFSLPCWLNFRSLMPSSIDDLLLLSLFARSSLLSFAGLSSAVFGSSRVTGMVDPILLEGYAVVNFLPKISLTKSLLGVLLFSLTLVSLFSLFFMREEDFMTSSSLVAQGFSSCAYFSDCLICDWQRSRSRMTDSNVSLSLVLRCGVRMGSASLRTGNFANSLANASAASMMEAVHSTSAKQVWISSFLKDSGCVFLAKSLMARRSLATSLRYSLPRMRWQVVSSPCLRNSGCVRRSLIIVCACSNHVESACLSCRRQSVVNSWSALLLYLASEGEVRALMMASSSGSERRAVLVRWKWDFLMQQSHPDASRWWQCSVMQNLVIFSPCSHLILQLQLATTNQPNQGMGERQKRGGLMDRWEGCQLGGMGRRWLENDQSGMDGQIALNCISYLQTLICQMGNSLWNCNIRSIPIQHHLKTKMNGEQKGRVQLFKTLIEHYLFEE